MRSMVIKSAVLLLLGLATAGKATAYIGCTISQEELAKIPTARDPWVVLQVTPGVVVDRIKIGNNQSDQDDFEELRAILLEAEAKALCREVRWDGWKGLTLERALRAASSQEETLVKADAANLLRGFIALLLHGKDCTEPPADVLAEAKEYSRRFGLPSSDRLPEP